MLLTDLTVHIPHIDLIAVTVHTDPAPMEAMHLILPVSTVAMLPEAMHPILPVLQQAVLLAA